MKRLTERLRSPVVVGAILAQIGVIITVVLPQISEQYKVVATAALELLILFGVLNNPVDKNNF